MVTKISPVQPIPPSLGRYYIRPYRCDISCGLVLFTNRFQTLLKLKTCEFPSIIYFIPEYKMQIIILVPVHFLLCTGVVVMHELLSELRFFLSVLCVIGFAYDQCYV